MESAVVSGVTYDKNEAKITLLGVPDRPGVAATIFTPLAEENINVDMIIQNISADGKYADLSFTVTMSDYERAMAIVKKKGELLGASDILGDIKIAKISIIGAGMRSHAGIAAKMFGALSKEGINIQMISTSEIKVSCVIDEKYIELGTRVLHDVFNLGKQGDAIV